jgi:hypothetical protein
VAKDQAISFDDIVYPTDNLAFKLYEEQVAQFFPEDSLLPKRQTVTA